MAEAICPTDDLQWLCQITKRVGDPHVDLAAVLGPGAPKVSVNNLMGVITNHEHPEVALSWDDKMVTVQRTDGGFMAMLKVEF
jgi:hypothetical protein